MFIPHVLLGIAVLHYMYAYVRRRGDETAAKNAGGNLMSNGFLIIFLVYRASCSFCLFSLVQVVRLW